MSDKMYQKKQDESTRRKCRKKRFCAFLHVGQEVLKDLILSYMLDVTNKKILRHPMYLIRQIKYFLTNLLVRHGEN